MLTTRMIPITAFLFLYLSLIVAANIQCIKRPESFDPDDCRAIIDMMPSGKLLVDPQEKALGNRTRFNLHIPDSVRKRRFALPAVFRSGGCAIFVSTLRPRTSYPRPPTSLGRSRLRGASAMYFTVWPTVKRLALGIVEGCPAEGVFRGGDARVDSRVQGHNLRYVVTIEKVPVGMGGDGSMFGEGYHHVSNVYEPSGTASGRSRDPFPPMPPTWSPPRNFIISHYRPGELPPTLPEFFN